MTTFQSGKHASVSDATDRLNLIITRFNQVAHVYDSVIGSMNYMSPTIVANKLGAYLEPGRQYSILEIGCGTGLCGILLKRFASRLDGVDISQNMVEKAKDIGAYDNLWVGDLKSHMETLTGENYDIVVAGGVLPYFSDLSYLLNLVNKSLPNGGYFAFTADNLDSGPSEFAPNEDDPMIFKHTQSYIGKTARQAGFLTITVQEYTDRDGWHDPDKKIQSIFYLMRKIAAEAR